MNTNTHLTNFCRNVRSGRLFVRLLALLFLGLLLLPLVPFTSTAEAADAALAQPDWGRIDRATNSTGKLLLSIQRWPSDSRLRLPTPFPNITTASLVRGKVRQSLSWVFNRDATEIYLELPKNKKPLPALVHLETAEGTGQFTEGRIVFSALDADVQGKNAKLESHPGNHRIGFWTDASDTANWNYKPTRWGMYDVELTYSAAGGEGTELEFEIAGQRFVTTRPATGSWYRYQTLPVGRFYLAKSAPFTVRAGCTALKGGAVMNLKALTLRPAPEGKPVIQEASGAITLHSRDAVTHSVKMRYEPASKKNCLGFWVNPADWAEWEFSVTLPGTFEVEVWQGCGRGHGGSDVVVEVGGEKLPFQVLETGHFQNFIPRRIGRVKIKKAGQETLAVRPVRKKAGAVMDIQQVRLIPVVPGA